MARPSSPNTRNFLRILSDPQRIILLSAGQGDLTKGFENVLDLYQWAYNKGYRPNMQLDSLGISVNNKQPQTEDCPIGS